MQEWLTEFIGTRVTVVQTDSTRLFGKLVCAAEDYAALMTRNGELLHIPYRHVKFVVTNHSDLVHSVDFSQTQLANRFIDAIESMRNCMVRIESTASVTGVLTEVRQDGLRLIQNMNETIHYNMTEVRNVCLMQQNNSNSDDETDFATDNSDTQADGGTRSQSTGVTAANCICSPDVADRNATSTSRADTGADHNTSRSQRRRSDNSFTSGMRKAGQERDTRDQDLLAAATLTGSTQAMPKPRQNNKLASEWGGTASPVLFSNRVAPSRTASQRSRDVSAMRSKNRSSSQRSMASLSSDRLYKDRRHVSVSSRSHVTPTLARQSADSRRTMPARGVQ